MENRQKRLLILKTLYEKNRFLDKNNKTFTLRSDILKDIPLFQKYLNEWIENNNIKDKVVLDK